MATVNRALALEPVNSGALMSTACEAYLMSGRAEQAIATCEKASGQSNHWEIHLLLAAAYANNGEQAKAAAARTEVLRVVPRSPKRPLTGNGRPRTVIKSLTQGEA